MRAWGANRRPPTPTPSAPALPPHPSDDERAGDVLMAAGRRHGSSRFSGAPNAKWRQRPVRVRLQRFRGLRLRAAGPCVPRTVASNTMPAARWLDATRSNLATWSFSGQCAPGASHVGIAISAVRNSSTPRAPRGVSVSNTLAPPTGAPGSWESGGLLGGPAGPSPRPPRKSP